jgi:hypothetical protein
MNTGAMPLHTRMVGRDATDDTRVATPLELFFDLTAKAGQMQLAQPALSMVWGWPLLGEHLSAAAVVTIVVVLGSVAIGRTTVVRIAQPDL